MAKQPTVLQLETVTRELNQAVSDVVKAWEQRFPAPSWEQEKEWERDNPSPRRVHGELKEQFHAFVSKDTHDFLLKIKLGHISNEEIYPFLKRELDRLHELKTAQLNLDA